MNYKRLDDLLAELYQQDRQYPTALAETYMNLYGTSNTNEGEWNVYVAQLSSLGLAVEIKGADTTMQITSKGRQIHELGGWIAFLTRTDQQERMMRLEQKDEEQEPGIPVEEETKIIELKISGKQQTQYSAQESI